MTNMKSSTSSNRRDDYYFSVRPSIEAHPLALFYFYVGGRAGGKTYGSLVYLAIDLREKFVFIKRTIEDVKILCAGSGKLGSKMKEYAADFSPFVPINRDLGTNIKAFDIIPGLGAFYPVNDDGTPCGDPVGYIVALNAVAKVKGFDLSICDWMVFDEFIPEIWERVNRREGDQFMQLYKTVARDREHRGKPPLKCIFLANAEQVGNPMFQTLELVDVVTDMQLKGEHQKYLEDRAIYIERINPNKEWMKKEEESKVYTAMSGTQWAQMALNNNFAYDDFTSVKKLDMRHYKLYCRCIHKHKIYYIYNNERIWYISGKANGRISGGEVYDLSRQTEAERFYYDVVTDLRLASIEGNVLYEKYSMFELIMYFKKLYRIGDK